MSADTGYLTTHVLDTVTGLPAAGVTVTLFHLSEDRREVLAEVVTNQDGRCDRPILSGAAFIPGIYELIFHIGDYFRRSGVRLADPAFLDVVPIRFGIADRTAHYHVPLLVSPYSLSTYRGS
jgi:5-hydroxyisourate hydrolase